MNPRTGVRCATTTATTAPAPNAAPLLRAPWRDLSDVDFLAHLRSERGVRYEPVIDAEEIAPARLDGVMAGRFEFNGQTHTLPDPIDWLVNPSHDIEWHILLHKFYYAVGLAQRWRRDGDAAAFARWVRLVDGWIAAAPPDFIAVDVTGRRVQNWIYSLHALLLATDRPAPFEPAFLRRLLASLYEQVEVLCAQLTPKRNHRTLELLAIFLAGVVFPEFERAATWREFALQETLANVQADLLPDGVHCELSTDYHHLALRNWLQVRRLAADNGHVVPRELDQALERALEFSLHVHQPGGSCPSLSDGDVRGFLPLLAQGAALYDRGDMQYLASAGREGTPPATRVAHFPSAGYHVIRSDWRDAGAQHLVFDVGPLGEGNHGHFDALSFELATFGRALVVDPGRYTYSEDDGDGTNWRVHFRGTAAHNTVCVDGLNQTCYQPKPVKPGTRHATGAVRHRIAGPAPDTALIEAHTGAVLDLLHGRCASHAYDAAHERCIAFVDRRYWIVSDWLRAPTEHDYALKFQLHDELVAHQRHDDDGCVQVEAIAADGAGVLVAQPHRNGCVTRLTMGWVSRRYGHKHKAPALHSNCRARDVDFDTVLLPVREGLAPLRAWDDAPAVGADGSRVPVLRIDLGTGARDGWFHARGAHGPFRLGPWRFDGRWLHWRTDAAGRLLRAVSHAGATLDNGQSAFALTTA